jgi:large subunit ribosomal protein L1
MAEKKAAKKTVKKVEATVEVVESPVVTEEVVEVAAVAPKKAAAKKSAPKAEKSGKKKLANSEKRFGKKYREVLALVDKTKEYSVEEAIEVIKKTSTTKFDSSVEVHIRLNVDPQNSEQQVRGSLVLPNGTGKTKKVLAIVSNDKEKEAKDAGADFVGSEDMIAKIEKGWLDFEIVVATPDMMPKLGKIGKILGTKGLMPNPKVGTVTPNVGKVITDIKKGMIEYKVDKTGTMHLIIGKVSFDQKKLVDNYNALLETIVRVKPTGVKGTYIKGISMATTMGPGVKLVTK